MFAILISILSLIYKVNAVEILYENKFLMNNEKWQITGNKIIEPAAHQSYNIENELSHYIMFKDTLINVDDKNPNDLAIKVIPKENNRISTSYLKIQTVQNLDIDIPTGYVKPVIVSSSEFQKMSKDMSNIGTTMKVTAKNFQIVFHCNAGGILKRTVQFGEEETDEDSIEGGSTEYSQDFLTEQLCRITKLSGLSNNMQIYPGKPLLFRSNVGSLGKISIYIKSKEQIESENYSTLIESDYSDD